MLRQVREYVMDKSFRFSYQDDRINVVNYLEIISLEENIIVLKYSKGLFLIKGKSLKITKLLEEEMLISGSIDTIELR